MAFPLSIFIVSLAGLVALFGCKVVELRGRETFLRALSRRGDALIAFGKSFLKHQSKTAHHEFVKPALRKAGEAVREGVASACEWCIKEMRQAARLMRGKEPTAPPEASVSVFLKQMLQFKNEKKE